MKRRPSTSVVCQGKPSKRGRTTTPDHDSLLDEGMCVFVYAHVCVPVYVCMCVNKCTRVWNVCDRMCVHCVFVHARICVG